MNDNFSNLELAWRTRNGGGGRTRRDYLDFIVNGKSLHDLLGTGDNIGCLGWLPLHVEQVILEQLKTERLSELGNDHYSIFICAECGDIGCGALTVQIEKTEDGFVWKNFGYQNNYDESMSDFESYETIGPFHFKSPQYLEALKSSQDLDERSRRNQKAS
jgi:hypothetical protein